MDGNSNDTTLYSVMTQTWNLTSNCSSNLMDMNFTLTSTQYIAVIAAKYIQPTLCVFGILGNLLSFCVFFVRKMRTVSINVYLAAQALSNFLFLSSLLITWMDVVRIRLMHVNGVCQLTVYITYCSSFLSTWLLVCVTVENFITNFFLGKAIRFSSVRNARIIVLIFVIVAALLYSFSLWSSAVIQHDGGPGYCTISEKYLNQMHVFTYIDTLVTLIIPTSVMLIFVVPACLKNILMSRKSKKPTRPILFIRHKSLLRVSRMLCVMTISFIIFTLPSHVLKIYHLRLFLTSEDGVQNHLDPALQFLCQMFYYCGFSCNFIYFMIWGKNFRKVILKFSPVPSVKGFRTNDLTCQCFTKQLDG